MTWPNSDPPRDPYDAEPPTPAAPEPAWAAAPEDEEWARPQEPSGPAPLPSAPQAPMPPEPAPQPEPLAWGPPPGQPPPAGPPPGPYSAYQPQPYPGQPYPGQPYPGPRATNGLAIAALVCSLAGLVTLISAPVGAVLGHVALRQIAQTAEEGTSMAKAAVWIGWIITGLAVVACCALVALALAAGRTGELRQ